MVANLNENAKANGNTNDSHSLRAVRAFVKFCSAALQKSVRPDEKNSHLEKPGIGRNVCHAPPFYKTESSIR